MKRWKHSLSNYKLLTMDMGNLVPIGLTEVLPGDTIQQATSALIRFTPQLAPVMHPITVRIHHWFVPHRLTMGPTWENFITGGVNGLGDGAAIPTNTGIFTGGVGGLGDCLGVTPGVALPIGTISALPFRAYGLIWNENYRDEDLITEIDYTSQANWSLRRVAWEKDYFTAARPWTQKGPAVSLPLGTSAPTTLTSGVVNAANARFVTVNGAGGSTDKILRQAGGNENIATDIDTTAFGDASGQIGVLANLTGTTDLTTATAATVNAVRQAFALQRYQEARAQYGSRYTEYLRYIGVRPSDARMQQPEYLGGGKQTVAFSEVLRTGNVTADATPNVIGQLKGHGIAALRSNRYRYFAEEHGYVMSLMSIRPKSIYVTGLERTWLKRTKEDFYQKELELIGQQAVTNAEVFVGAVDATNKLVFGYQDRYAEYRHTPSGVSGEFRTTLNFWHLGRIFGALPTLNQAFIECDPGKRVFAEQTAASCWVMVNHNIQARRMVGKNTIGRAI